MVRISDARMSGTSHGACVLHVAPEAFVGGPRAFVQTGISPPARPPHAEGGAIVGPALAASPAWGSGSALAGRAGALEAVADALDDRAGELAVIADTETALGGDRLIGEVARTTAQLRLFAAVLQDGGRAWGGGSPGPAPGYTDAVVTPAQGVIPDLRPMATAVGPAAAVSAPNFPS